MLQSNRRSHGQTEIPFPINRRGANVILTSAIKLEQEGMDRQEGASKYSRLAALARIS